MVGYLLVRGGVHIVAYAKVLRKFTGANVGPTASHSRHQQQKISGSDEA